MIKSIRFHHFKILQDAELPLGRFTLLVGPNGSGKTTALQGLELAASNITMDFGRMLTAGLPAADGQNIDICIHWEIESTLVTCPFEWELNQGSTNFKGYSFHDQMGQPTDSRRVQQILSQLGTFKVFAFDALNIASAGCAQPNPQLSKTGANLVTVLNNLSDQHPERFEALNDELGRWMPEFDRILFENGSRSFHSLQLRTRSGHYQIPASDLSQGTLFALAFLTLAYLPNPPAIVGFEELERGIHPRLLRGIRDGLYRLAYPEIYGEQRPPVQVIATTHSPYLLELYKEHPEEVVIAEKDRQAIRFERLSEKFSVEEVLHDVARSLV